MYLAKYPDIIDSDSKERSDGRKLKTGADVFANAKASLAKGPDDEKIIISEVHGYDIVKCSLCQVPKCS